MIMYIVDNEKQTRVTKDGTEGRFFNFEEIWKVQVFMLQDILPLNESLLNGGIYTGY